MRKVIIFFLVVLSVASGYWLARNFTPGTSADPKPKKEILKVAIVADSHSDNELLKKALVQSKEAGVNFVIGLGDYTNVGTLEELEAAKRVFDESGLKYFVTAGDHDLWDGRNQQIQRSATESADVGEALDNFREVFREPAQTFEQKQIQFVILDNSDIYKGINSSVWQILNSSLNKSAKLHLVFAHKAPYHPQSAHIMGEETPGVATQARDLATLLEQKKVDGFFSGDLHFFAKFNSALGSVKMTTIGAVTTQRNFQGPRFGILRIYEDYSWDVDDVEIQ